MGYMKQDGISGSVSDHLDNDAVTVVETRPDDHPFVRVTHFPYETRVDQRALHDADGGDFDGLPEIPLGQVYEVTLWKTPNCLQNTWVPSNGIAAACAHAAEVAADHDAPIWETIRRLRPSHVLVDHEPMETVPGDYELAVQETDDGWRTLNRVTGATSHGATREEALDGLTE